MTGAENNRSLRETATLVSLKRKPKEVDEGLLKRGWNALIQLKELELPELPEGKPQLSETSASAQSVVESAIQHCGERELVFRRTKLERFVFEHQLGGQSFDQVEDEIATHPELIQVEEGKFTTQAALNLELNTIRLMQQGRGEVNAIAPTATVEACLKETSLNGEQKGAVAIAATTLDQVMAWQGVAGAGKTYTLNTLKELAQAQGFEVRGLAPSAEAAHGLGEALGIETETVAGLLVSQTPEQLQQSTLWIVDEAGLLSMKDGQGKTANRVLALLGETTHREAFYVAISRAKHELTLYTANREELTRLAQVST